jgi:hypothetical protein
MYMQDSKSLPVTETPTSTVCNNEAGHTETLHRRGSFANQGAATW